VYEKGKSTQIDLADFISRTEYLQKACTENCRICADVETPVDKKYTERLEISTMEINPGVRFDKFEEIYATLDEKAFKWLKQEDMFTKNTTMNTNNDEVNRMVLRSRKNRLERKVSNREMQVSKIASLRAEMLSYKNASFIRDM